MRLCRFYAIIHPRRWKYEKSCCSYFFGCIFFGISVLHIFYYRIWNYKKFCDTLDSSFCNTSCLLYGYFISKNFFAKNCHLCDLFWFYIVASSFIAFVSWNFILDFTGICVGTFVVDILVFQKMQLIFKR